jgi:probable rRNA maturation factor
MSVALEIAVEAPAWHEFPGAETLIRRAVEAAYADAGVTGELSVVLSDDDRMRKLNRAWRGKDLATNVLSFPALSSTGGAPRLLGDIVLAYETVMREAGAQRIPTSDHLTHLVVHGALHLLGYDHERERDAAAMEARERAILGRLGVPDPYAPAHERAMASP